MNPPSFQFVAVHAHPLWRNFQIDFLPPVSAAKSELSAHSSELMLPQMPEPVRGAAPAPACCNDVGGECYVTADTEWV